MRRLRKVGMVEGKELKMYLFYCSMTTIDPVTDLLMYRICLWEKDFRLIPLTGICISFKILGV